MKKTKFATMLATGALALTAVPLSAVGADEGNGVKEINTQGTLTVTAPEDLDMYFSVGDTAVGALTQSSGGHANFEASQKLLVMSNIYNGVTNVSATVSRMTTPWGKDFAMYVGEGETAPTATTMTVSKPNRVNFWTSYNFNFKSEPMKYQTGAAAMFIAGDYRATVDYRITAGNDES